MGGGGQHVSPQRLLRGLDMEAFVYKQRECQKIMQPGESIDQKQQDHARQPSGSV
jgi:hypothetical protein